MVEGTCIGRVCQEHLDKHEVNTIDVDDDIVIVIGDHALAAHVVEEGDPC
jgi:hypothetical protein